MNIDNDNFQKLMQESNAIIAHEFFRGLRNGGIMGFVFGIAITILVFVITGHF